MVTLYYDFVRFRSLVCFSEMFHLIMRCIWKVMPLNVSYASDVTLKENLSQLIHCFLSFQFAIGWDFVNIVICILFGSEWMTCFQLYQTTSCYRIFYAWKWSCHWNSQVVTGCLWWRYCEHKYCSLLGEKIKVFWWKFGPKRPAVVWHACHHNSRCEQAKSQWIYSRKWISFSES